jgi:GLPGLI family protein
MQNQLFSLFLASLFFFTNVNLFAQVKKATVVYEETFHFEIPEQFKAQMPQNMPTKAENSKILQIIDKQSYFKPAPVKEDLTPTIDNQNRGGGRGMGFMMRAAGGNEEIFTNLTDKKQLTKANFFNRDFIVKENFDKYKWRVVASEQREILGYTCMKAEYRDSLNLVTVWFTPQIQMQHGPSGLHGLPGLILAASVGENKILLAKSINLNDETVEFKPLEEKKDSMTREAYDKMIKERMAEMQSMWQSRRPGG